jgi:hypothetical protein
VGLTWGQCEGWEKDDEDCRWCVTRSLQCGPKFLKTEFINVVNGQACPKKRVSDLAKDLEKANPNIEPSQVYELVGIKMRESEETYERLAMGTYHCVSSARLTCMCVEGKRWTPSTSQSPRKKKKTSKRVAIY